jgi:hypothetical protein
VRVEVGTAADVRAEDEDAAVDDARFAETLAL